MHLKLGEMQHLPNWTHIPNEPALLSEPNARTTPIARRTRIGWGLSPNEPIGPEFHQWSAAARPKCFVEGVES